MAADCVDSEDLNQALKSIMYAVPPGAKSVPWLDKLDITAKDTLPQLQANADLEREKHIQDLTLNAACIGMAKLKAMGLNFQCPKDYQGEMVKSEAQMVRTVKSLQKVDLQT